MAHAPPSPPDRRLGEIHNLVRERLLGQGTFGQVWLVHHCVTQEQAVIKTIKVANSKQTRMATNEGACVHVCTCVHTRAAGLRERTRVNRALRARGARGLGGFFEAPLTRGGGIGGSRRAGQAASPEHHPVGWCFAGDGGAMEGGGGVGR